MIESRCGFAILDEFMHSCSDRQPIRSTGSHPADDPISGSDSVRFKTLFTYLFMQYGERMFLLKNYLYRIES